MKVAKKYELSFSHFVVEIVCFEKKLSMHNITGSKLYTLYVQGGPKKSL